MLEARIGADRIRIFFGELEFDTEDVVFRVREMMRDVVHVVFNFSDFYWYRTLIGFRQEAHANLQFINVRGAEESAGVNIGLAVTDFATQLLLVVLGFFLVFNPDILVDNVHLGIAPTTKDFFLAIPVAMIAYTGIETISNMAEEAKDESKTIPAAIKRVVIAVFVIYAALPAIALSALPVYKDAAGEYTTKLAQPESTGGFAGDPVLGIVKHMDLGALQNAGEIYVGLLAATILFIATNAGIIGVSRLVYSMGLHRQLPERASKLHPKFGTPAFGIVVLVTAYMGWVDWRA